MSHDSFIFYHLLWNKKLKLRLQSAVIWKRSEFPAQRKHWTPLRTITLILRSFNLETLLRNPKRMFPDCFITIIRTDVPTSDVWHRIDPRTTVTLLFRAAAAVFCGPSTTTSYSRAGDDLIHEPSSIPKGQSYSTQDNKTRALCTAPCLMWLAAKPHPMWDSWPTRMTTKDAVIINI